jgi:hypothetical protein
MATSLLWEQKVLAGSIRISLRRLVNAAELEYVIKELTATDSETWRPSTQVQCRDDWLNRSGLPKPDVRLAFGAVPSAKSRRRDRFQLGGHTDWAGRGHKVRCDELSSPVQTRAECAVSLIGQPTW